MVNGDLKWAGPVSSLVSTGNDCRSRAMQAAAIRTGGYPRGQAKGTIYGHRSVQIK